jgi:hypothetical protein
MKANWRNYRTGEYRYNTEPLNLSVGGDAQFVIRFGLSMQIYSLVRLISIHAVYSHWGIKTQIINILYKFHHKHITASVELLVLDHIRLKQNNVSPIDSYNIF